MDSSPKLMWDDPSLYTESCGVMDPTIRDLDQQILLNDMILCANGGMPYMSQDPALQGNPPPAFDNSWQFYHNELEGSSSLPSAQTHSQRQTQTAASSSQMIMDAKLCDRSRGPPPPPSSENRRSHHPRAGTPNHHHQHASTRGTESNGSSESTSCSSISASATSISATSSPHSERYGGAQQASKFSAAAPRNQYPRRNPNVNPANRQVATTRQKKQLYHYQQQQQHGRMLADSQAAAAVHHEAIAAKAKATADAEAEAARTTTAPPERHLELTQRDMPEATRQVAEMGNHLRNAAHEQRKMVEDTLKHWRGSTTTRV